MSAGGGAYGIGNLVEDLSPQLGGNLDLFNKFITGTGGANITGVVTATQFRGDGSQLTGIIAEGSGIVVKDSGSNIGIAGTINFGDNLSVTPVCWYCNNYRICEQTFGSGHPQLVVLLI